jgi:hypothetical protein
MSMRSWPQIRLRPWRAVKLNSLAKRTLALTIEAYRAGLLGPSATYVGLSIASTMNHMAMRLVRWRSDEGGPMGSVAFDPQSQYVVSRFLLKLAILSIAALVQLEAPWGFRIAIMSIATFSTLTSSGLAVFWRERPLSGSLNY